MMSNTTTHCIGRSEYGRLGLGDNARDVSRPTEIPILENLIVNHVACGEAVSFAITSEGKVIYFHSKFTRTASSHMDWKVHVQNFSKYGSYLKRS